MKKVVLLLLTCFASIAFVSCSSDDDVQKAPEVVGNGGSDTTYTPPSDPYVAIQGRWKLIQESYGVVDPPISLYEFRPDTTWLRNLQDSQAVPIKYTIIAEEGRMLGVNEYIDYHYILRIHGKEDYFDYGIIFEKDLLHIHQIGILEWYNSAKLLQRDKNGDGESQ